MMRIDPRPLALALALAAALAPAPALAAGAFASAFAAAHAHDAAYRAARHELEAGVVMAQLVDLLDLETRLPKLGFLRDPAYLTLDLPGSCESGFEVILRENPYRGANGEGVVSLAALTAPAGLVNPGRCRTAPG